MFRESDICDSDLGRGSEEGFEIVWRFGQLYVTSPRSKLTFLQSIDRQMTTFAIARVSGHLIYNVA